MRRFSIKSSIFYQIIFLMFALYCGHHGAYKTIDSSLSLLLTFSYLFIDYILVHIITIKTKFLKNSLYTLRLAQIQSLFLLTNWEVPLVVQYVVAVLIFYRICLMMTELVLQETELKPFQCLLLFGISTIVIPFLAPSYSQLSFLFYLIVAMIGTLGTVYKKWNHTYIYSKNWSYWLILGIFLLNTLFFTSIIVFLPVEQLFSGIWQLVNFTLVVIYCCMLMYNNHQIFHQKSHLSLLVLLFLIYWILFSYILERPLVEVIWTEFLFFQIAYIGRLIYSLVQLENVGSTDYAGLGALVREEKLKAEFATFLHDDILQDINAMIQLSRVAPSKEILQLINENLERLNEFTRARMNFYSPQLLKGLSLYENYRQLIPFFKKRYPDSEMVIHVNVDRNLTLAPPYDILVYRWMRELINNSYKYAQAESITITLSREGSSCEFIVEDDGIYKHHFPISEGYGLSTLKAQVKAIGGRLHIYQVQSHGFGIHVYFEIEGDKAIESFINR